ncbi:hypothetical protein [Sphaerisporangium dianthi]|uniref:Protein kinase domain-containing protein n=1 Tax=Sphaerisporangium dianthi TaxID=1436120 RepID=A0ABV9CS94_9ACTN
MGQVWRGATRCSTARSRGREVAIKLIRPELVAYPEHAEVLTKRFRR